MNNLRNIIKYLILEASAPHPKIEDIMYDRFIEESMGDAYIKLIKTGNGFDIEAWLEGSKIGILEVIDPKASRPHWGRCLDAYTVVWASAENNIGPLLYDVAIEYASKHSAGLTCDRGEVSPEAYSVWEYYLFARKDVKQRQLDMMSAPFLQKDKGLPNDPKDDCDEKSSMENYGSSSAWDEDTNTPTPGYKDYWLTEDPLAKVYYKTNDPTIQNLKHERAWIEE